MHKLIGRAIVSASLLLVLAACGAGAPDVQSPAESTAPVAQSPETLAQNVLPSLDALQGMASPSRRVSDTELETDGINRVDEGGANNQDLPDGTFAIIPSGDDDLAWAVYRLPDLNTERPVQLNVEAQAIIPSGDEDLAYWVLLSDYSKNRWEPRGPFNGPISLTLNSEEVRQRYVSRADGANIPAFAFAIVTLGIAGNNPDDPPLEQPRVEISLSRTIVRDVAEETYFATSPYHSALTAVGGGIEGGTPGDPVTLTFSHVGDPVAGGKNEASGYEIARQDLTGPSQASANIDDWIIGSLSGSGGTSRTYTDPDDNDSFAEAPQPGRRYRYFLRSTAAGGTQGNWAQLGADLHVPLVLVLDTPVGGSDRAGTHTSIALVDGCPAIAYFATDTTESLRYIKSLDPRGEQWSLPVTLDTEISAAGGYTSLLVVDGHPAVSYYGVSFPGGPGELLFVRALDSEGNTWDSPQTLASDSSSNVGFYTSMQIVDGHPAVSYFDESSNNLMYIRASSADGSTWNAPVTADDGGGVNNVGSFTSMQIVDGRPAIAYMDTTDIDVKFVRAADNTGTSWGTPSIADPMNVGGAGGGHISLAVVHGRPAVSFVQTRTLDHSIRYVRSDDAHGITWPASQSVYADAVYSLNAQTKLFMWDGMPVVIHSGTPNGFQLRKANDASGTSWPATPFRIDPGSGNGGHCSVVLLPSGIPVFSYHANSQRTLKFANPF